MELAGPFEESIFQGLQAAEITQLAAEAKLCLIQTASEPFNFSF